MLFVRFDKNEIKNGQKSFNHFSGEELSGLCAFKIENEENYLIDVRNIADKNSNYVDFAEGSFIVFEGSLIEDNFNGVGVIVDFYEKKDSGKLITSEYGYKITRK